MNTPMKWTLAVVIAVLFVPASNAHTAAPPDDHMVRLLHDCNDDYFGGDGLTTKAGHDLHALDLREAWSQSLGHHVVFHVILNGDDDGTITVETKAGSATKSWDFTRSSGTWSGTFDKVTHIPDIGDGDRFVLEGSVSVSKLGISTGGKLSQYTLTGQADGDEADSVPGNDRTVGECADEFKRPDYTLKGPVQYVDATFQETAPSVKAGQEKFITLSVQNKLRDNTQSVDLQVTATGGASVRFHDPASGEYVEDATFDLNKRGSGGDTASIHVALTGSDAGDSGSIKVVATTSLGGRTETSTTYSVTAADAPPPDNGGDGDGDGDGNGDQESPGLPFVALLGALLVAARRR